MGQWTTASHALGVSALVLSAAWPIPESTAAIIDFQEPIIVRATGNGRIVSWAVQKGRFVERDELLFRQEHHQLAGQVGSLVVRIDQSILRERRYQQQSPLAAKRAEIELHRESKSELDARSLELDEFAVRAPHAGNRSEPIFGDRYSWRLS